MGGSVEPSSSESWRVVVVTNLPGGIVYQATVATLQPLGHRVVGVLTSPGPVQRRSNAYLSVVPAVRPEIDVIVSNHPRRFAAQLAPLRPDLIVCCGFPWRIPDDAVALPRYGAINFHPSLLPRWRGPNPVGWAFRAGETETGLTAHRLEHGFDTGPILAQATVPIADDDDIWSMTNKLGQQFPGLLVTALERLSRGESGEPQAESAATYAGFFEEEWRRIDWSRPARAVHNQVRSWVGFTDIAAGARAQLDGEPVVISKTRLLPNGEGAGAPGTLLSRAGETLTVQCGDGPLEILAWSRAES